MLGISPIHVIAALQSIGSVNRAHPIDAGWIIVRLVRVAVAQTVFQIVFFYGMLLCP